MFTIENDIQFNVWNSFPVPCSLQMAVHFKIVSISFINRSKLYFNSFAIDQSVQYYGKCSIIDINSVAKFNWLTNDLDYIDLAFRRPKFKKLSSVSPSDCPKINLAFTRAISWPAFAVFILLVRTDFIRVYRNIAN